MHILILPALAGALLLASFRPSLRWPRRVRPDPLLVFTCAVLVALGALVQINPVWLIGPYQPGSISAGAVPDWYMGFLDGALRLMPAWELTVAGHPLALGVLIPALVVPGLFFTCLFFICLALYPLADRRITGGRPPRGLLPPAPADPANRTAVGVAGVTLYGLLWAAAANDQIAYHLQIPLYTVTWIFRVLVLAGPALAFGLTRVICHALAGRRRDEELHGRETGRIVRNPHGGYDEIREPAHRRRRVTLVRPDRRAPDRSWKEARCHGHHELDRYRHAHHDPDYPAHGHSAAVHRGQPFRAQPRQGAAGIRRSAEADRRRTEGTAAQTPPCGTPSPPDTCTFPVPASATTAPRPRRAAGSKRCRSSSRRQNGSTTPATAGTGLRPWSAPAASAATSSRPTPGATITARGI